MTFEVFKVFLVKT